jgi:tetratricopeptide (TPR) repeat protein
MARFTWAALTLLALLPGLPSHGAAQPARADAGAGAIQPRPASADRGFVGAKACAGCHAAAYEAWAGSQHRRSMQAADASTVLGDFRDARFTYAGTTSRFFVRDGRYFVRTDGADGKAADFEIRYTFGVAPLQQYLVEFPDGRLQALGIAWDSRPKAQGGHRWFHLYPGQNLKAGDALHWTGGDQNWNFMCAECHSTDLVKGFDAQSGRFNTTWSEIDVACEACHGPGARHLAWARAMRPGQPGADPGKGLAVSLDERKGVLWTPAAAKGQPQRSTPRTGSREIDVCARCHARASRIADDYVHGKPPLDTHRPVRLDEGLYWDDGQMRDEVFNWGSFLQSKMNAKGVTCSDCHDPHSQALRRPGNGVCAGCHAPGHYDTTAHTHHAQGTPGAACAACHMPTTTYMVVDPRHDHSIRIPRPDVSARLGMPNACNKCHARKTPQWASEAIVRWTGHTPVGYQNFAEAFHAGRVGAPGARTALTAIIDDRAQPAIVRASAIDRLARWLTPATLGSVTGGLADPDPLVRLAAVEALASTPAPMRAQWLARVTSDAVLAVRIQAARALAGDAQARIPAADQPAFARALQEYVAVQWRNADRPEGRLSLGDLYAAQGDAVRALAEFRKALEIDPSSLEGCVNLADLQRAQGHEAEAEATLRRGIARTPQAATLHHALGLSLVRQRRGKEALSELAQAVKLAPGNARHAYVYAVALNDAGQPKEALEVLTDALKREPFDRDLLFGLAHYSAAAGHRDAARRYARQLTDLDPESREFQQLAATLAAAPSR